MPGFKFFPQTEFQEKMLPILAEQARIEWAKVIEQCNSLTLVVDGWTSLAKESIHAANCINENGIKMFLDAFRMGHKRNSAVNLAEAMLSSLEKYEIRSCFDLNA